MPPPTIFIDLSHQRQLSDCSMQTMLDDICSLWASGGGGGNDTVAQEDKPVNQQDKNDSSGEKNPDCETQVTMNTSPFLKYDQLDGGYKYPTLHQECDEMLQACILIYPMADLRTMARQGVIQDDTVLKLPLSAFQVLEAVETYKDDLMDTNAFGNEFHRDILKAVHERQLSNSIKKEEPILEMEPPEGESTDDYIQDDNADITRVVAFDDEFQKEELVYAIAVNPHYKRITVVFRGSITKQDWAANMEAYMKEIPNPMASRHASQQPTVHVHHGFHDYMFAPNERGSTGPDGEPLSEYQEILQHHVLPVIEKYPDYKLYITGHSLGGALATLFAFEVAAMPDDTVPKPVSCFTFGAPYVGDESFRQANRLLQGLGKLRHLRITNHKDLVTTIPKMAFKFNLFDSNAHVGTLFKHTGMNLKMYASPNEPVEVSFPMIRTGWWNSFYDEAIRGWDQAIFSNLTWNLTDVSWHAVSEYNRRLLLQKKRLNRMHLNDLYSREDIVGRLVAEF